MFNRRNRKFQTSSGACFLLVVILYAILAEHSAANDFFVSAEGRLSGDGSMENPWGLEQTIARPPESIRPGDTIWVRGGVYRGVFQSKLSGTSERPITLRAFPNERIQIDLYDPHKANRSGPLDFFVLGDHGVYAGLEIYSSDPGPRTTDHSGVFPPSIQRGGITVRGNHNRLVNLVIHDLNAGIGHWGEGGEVYGTIAYNNGWVGGDRQHGHGLYVQNSGETKSIEDNILFNQFGAGIHAYGSQKATLKNIKFVGNVSFNNGAAAGENYQTERDILIGGSMVIEGVELKANRTFQNRLDGVVDIGYLWGPENRDISITDNYFVSRFRVLQGWQQIEFERNTIIHTSDPVSMKPPQDESLTSYRWDHNRYLNHPDARFQLGDSRITFSRWRQTTGFDKQSLWGEPERKNKIFVVPNTFEKGRGHVVIYNWTERPTVDVELSALLEVGDSFMIHSVFDLYGEPEKKGVFDGKKVKLSMRKRVPPLPIGSREVSSVGTDSRFAVFMVSKVQNVPKFKKTNRKTGNNNLLK